MSLGGQVGTEQGPLESWRSWLGILGLGVVRDSWGPLGSGVFRRVRVYPGPGAGAQPQLKMHIWGVVVQKEQGESWGCGAQPRTTLGVLDEAIGALLAPVRALSTLLSHSSLFVPFLCCANPDINELNLPKTCDISFSDPDDLLNFKLVICPDEVRAHSAGLPGTVQGLVPK